MRTPSVNSLHPKSFYQPIRMLDFKASLLLDRRVKAWDLWCLCQLIHRGRRGSNLKIENNFFNKKNLQRLRAN
jgi:hypothetical protein